MSTSWGALRDAYLARVRLYGCGRHAQLAEHVLTRFERWLELVDPYELSVEEITPELLARFLASRRGQVSVRTGQPLSPATINCDIRYLRGCLLHATELGWDWQPPRMRRLRELRHEPTIASDSCLRRALAAVEHATRPVLPTTKPAEWWRCLLGLAFATGARCRGLLHLRMPSAEQLERGEISLPASGDKAGQARTFPLPAWAVDLVRAMPVEVGQPLLPWPHGRRHLYTVLHDFQRAAGIPRAEHVTPHMLRRTLATHLARAGAALTLVQRQLGHSSPLITQRSYVGVLAADQREAIAAVPSPVVRPPRERQLEFSFG